VKVFVYRPTGTHFVRGNPSPFLRVRYLSLMKIIIKESKIDMLMTEYLNSWVENTTILNYRDFILIQQKDGIDEDDWIDWMEYDFNDGRLWINNIFKKFMSDLFGKSVLDIFPIVTKWFEDKFNVKVEYSE